MQYPLTKNQLKNVVCSDSDGFMLIGASVGRSLVESVAFIDSLSKY